MNNTRIIHRKEPSTYENSQYLIVFLHGYGADGADLFNLAESGNIYSRIMNPTCDVLEQRIAAAEGGAAALCMASGMAAITATINTLCCAGDNIVSVNQLYGGTYNLFAHTLPQQGIWVRMASGDDIEALEAEIDDRTKAIFCESIKYCR